jgi:hypothetical protein
MLQASREAAMAYVDTGRPVPEPASSIAWEAAMAQLDLGRIVRQPRFKPEIEQDRHLRHVRQMLLAAGMAAGAIVAVAGVMMLGVL